MNPIEMAGQMFNQLKQNVGGAFNQFSSGVQNVAHNIEQGAGQAVQQATSGSLPDISGLFNNPSQTYQDIKPITDTFSSAVGQIPSLAQQAYKQVAPMVTDSAKQFAKGFTNPTEADYSGNTSFPYAAGQFAGGPGAMSLAGGTEQAGKAGFNLLQGVGTAGAVVGANLLANKVAGQKTTPQDQLVPAVAGFALGSITHTNPEGLIPFGETKGIIPEAAKSLAAIRDTIFQNRGNYDDPTYFGKTFLDDKNYNEFVKADPDLNNHQGGPDTLRNARGNFGYIATDQATVPPDKNVPNLVIDPHVADQFTKNNGDRVLSIVRENPEQPGTYDIVDGHHTFPTARAIGLDKIPVIILDKNGPTLSESFDRIKAGGTPLDVSAGQVKNQEAPQGIPGEAALNPDKIAKLAPEYATDQGKSQVQGILNKAEKAQPALDDRFKQLAEGVGLDPEKDFESRIKQPDTFIQKIAQHRLEGTDKYDAKGVNDAYGGRFIADTDQQKGQIIRAFNQLDQMGEFKILKQQNVVKDTYNAYHIDFVKNGVKGEIQIHDPNSLLESVVNHEIRAEGGEKPPPAMQAEKEANANAAHQMPSDIAQDLAQAGEKAKSNNEPLPWETKSSQGQQTIGQMQQANQSPDLTAYENAFNSGDTKTMDSLAAKYPSDVRYQVHKTLGDTQFAQTGTVPTQAAIRAKVTGFNKDMGMQMAPPDPTGKNMFDATTGEPSKPTPPDNAGLTGRAALKPEDVAQQARLAHFAQTQVVQQRANTLAQFANKALKSPQDQMNLRFAMEFPDKLDMYAEQSSNPQAFKNLAKQYSDFTDYISQSAKGQKMDLGTVKDYFTHIWDLSKPEDKQRFEDLMAANANNFKSGFTKERLFQTLQEGLDAGFTLKNPKVSQDIMQYANSMGKQLAASAYNNKINELRPNGAVAFKNQGTVPYNYAGQVFQQSKVPGNQGTFIDPEIAQHEGFYNKSVFADNKAVGAADKVNQFMKNVGLSMGGFHALKTTARQVINNPLIIPQAITNAAYGPARLAFRQKAIDEGVIDYGSKIGVTFGQSGDVMKADASTAEKISSKNPIEAFHRSLFGGLIDTYKINLTKSIMNKFDLSDPQQAKQAQDYGAQINNLMGGINYEMLNRNKTTQQLLRFTTLAPDFNEGKIRQVMTSLNPTNFSPAAQFARKNILGETVVYGTLAALGTYMATGSFSPSFQSFVQNNILDPNITLPNNSTFNNPQTGKQQVAKLPSNDIGDVYRAITDPQHFFQARGSALVSKVAQLASGKDYYGRSLVNQFKGEQDTLANRAKALLPNSMPIPFVQGMKFFQGKETLADAAINAAGARVGNDPNTPSAIAQKAYFDGLKKASDSLNPNDKNVFNSLHPQTKDADGNPVIDKSIAMTAEKYDTLLHNPKVLAAEAAFQKSLPNHDPLWDAPDWQRNIVMAQADHLPGQKSTYSQLTNGQQWYQNLQQARSQFFQSIAQNQQPMSGTGGTDQATTLPKPQASDYVQQQMNAKNWKDPQVQAYLNATTAYNNSQLAAMGLPNAPAQASSGAARGAGGFTSSQRRMIKSRLSITGGGGKLKSVTTGGTKTSSGKMLATATSGGGKMLANKVKSGGGIKIKTAPTPKTPKMTLPKKAALKLPKMVTAKVAQPKQLKQQAFRMPKIQKINMKQLGAGVHSQKFAKYTYQ